MKRSLALLFCLLPSLAWGQSRFFNVPSGRTSQACTASTGAASSCGSIGVDAIVKCGLVGDGSTDDTGALQTCLDANPVVTFPVPKVSYKLCGVLLNSDQVLLFPGAAGAVFVKTGCTAAWNLANTAGFSITTAGTSYQPGDVVTLSYAAAGGVANPKAASVPMTVNILGIGLNAVPTVSNAGASGTPGSCVVTGTTGTGTPYTANVTIGGGGTISSVNSVATAGSYSALPSATDPVTSNCGLTGAPALTVSQSYADYSPVSIGIKAPGPVLSTPPTGAMATTGDNGSGLTITGSWVPTVFSKKDPVGGINVSIHGLWLLCNGSGQSGRPVEGIYLHNMGAAASQIPRDRIIDTHIEKCAGINLHAGFQTREMLVQNYNSYQAGTNGLYVENADSTYDNITVGQSAGANVILASTAGRLSNAKIWFSGASTANFDGILCNKCSYWKLTAIETQDNGGCGFRATGSGNNFSSNLAVQIVDQGANGANNGSSGICLFKTKNSVFDISVGASNDISNAPTNLLNITSSTGNVINLAGSGQTSFPVGGSWAGNTIILPTVNNISVPASAAVAPAQGTVLTTSGSVTPFPMTFGTYQITGVSGALTWANPSTGNGNTPAGLSLCFDWTQDGTGGHAISFGVNYKSPGVVTTTANTRTLACFRTEDGTTWLPTSFFTGM